MNMSAKISIIGDKGVGKTSFYAHLMEEDPKRFHTENYIGFWIMRFKNNKGNEDKVALSDMTDLIGLSPNSEHIVMDGSDGFLVCYDVNNRKSFENVPKWIESALNHSPNAYIGIVGMKADDKGGNREVSIKEAIKLVDKYNRIYGGIYYFGECSSLSGIGKYTKESFTDFVKMVLYKPIGERVIKKRRNPR